MRERLYFKEALAGLPPPLVVELRWLFANGYGWFGEGSWRSDSLFDVVQRWRVATGRPAEDDSEHRTRFIASYQDPFQPHGIDATRASLLGLSLAKVVDDVFRGVEPFPQSASELARMIDAEIAPDVADLRGTRAIVAALRATGRSIGERAVTDALRRGDIAVVRTEQVRGKRCRVVRRSEAIRWFDGVERQRTARDARGPESMLPGPGQR